MLLLLKQLHQLRSGIALPRPPGGSCAFRHVDAGSCNGCEHELNAVMSPYYDLPRFGWNLVASPRHADVLLVTGAVTVRMKEPLLRAWEAMPEPRVVAALGNCALGEDWLGMDKEQHGGVDQLLTVAIRIPGCPPSPEEIARHLSSALADRALGLGSSRTAGRSQASD